MSEKPKVLVGVPGFAGLQPETQEPFMAMMYEAGRSLSSQYDVAVKVVPKKEQFRARNFLIDQAIGGGFHWLLMLDDDMGMPADLLGRLLGHDKDVCGALYYQRGGAFHPVIMRHVALPNGDYAARFIRYDDPVLTTPGLHEVDIIGGGCMLFKVEVFRKLLPPYFWWEHTTGTDIAICMRLREAGYTIWCDTSVELAHYQSDRQPITSRSIPLSMQAMGAVNEQLWTDATEYLGMHAMELESRMYQASIGEQHRERWESAPRETWEQVRQYYQEHGSWHIENLLYFNLLSRVPMKEWVLMTGEAMLGPGRRIIDYGCGLGHLSVPLAERGYKVYALDVAGAATLPFVEWRAKRHELLPHPNRHKGIQIIEMWEPVPPHPVPVLADAAICLSVIEHAWDPAGVAQWLAANVRPGGWLVMDYQVGTRETEPQHLRRYDPHTWERQMKAWGWQVSPEYYWLFFRE